MFNKDYIGCHWHISVVLFCFHTGIKYQDHFVIQGPELYIILTLFVFCCVKNIHTYPRKVIRNYYEVRKIVEFSETKTGFILRPSMTEIWIFREEHRDEILSCFSFQHVSHKYYS